MIWHCSLKKPCLCPCNSTRCSVRSEAKPRPPSGICHSFTAQVILCQKHSFLHHLTQNMMKVVSLITSSVQENCKFRKCCLHQIVLNVKTKTNTIWCTLYTTCIELAGFLYWTRTVVVFWVKWCKNECFRQRITCAIFRGTCNYVIIERIPFYIQYRTTVTRYFRGCMWNSTSIICWKLWNDCQVFSIKLKKYLAGIPKLGSDAFWESIIAL